MSRWSASWSSVLSMTLFLVSLAFVWMEHRSRPQLRVHQTYGTYRSPVTVQLGPWAPVVLLYVSLVAFFGVVLPLVVLGYWSWTGLAGGSLGQGLRFDPRDAPSVGGSIRLRAVEKAVPVIGREME